MAPAFEISAEKLVHNFTGCLFVEKSAWQHQYVGIVMLAGQMCNFWHPCKPGADSLMLVECHADAFARPAYTYAGINLALLNAVGQRMAKVRIVGALFGVGAIVLVGDAFLFEVLLHKLFQGEASVIAGQTYSFDFHCCYFLFAKESLHLSVHVLSSITEFLVEHLVGCRESEALHAEDTAVGPDAHEPL